MRKPSPVGEGSTKQSGVTDDALYDLCRSSLLNHDRGPPSPSQGKALKVDLRRNKQTDKLPQGVDTFGMQNLKSYSKSFNITERN